MHYVKLAYPSGKLRYVFYRNSLTLVVSKFLDYHHYTLGFKSLT